MVKNRYQIRFERLGGSIWKGLGTVWGVFWALLGVFWRFSWTFGINTFGNIGPRWALRACWDRFWDGFGWVWEGFGQGSGGFGRVLGPIWEVWGRVFGSDLGVLGRFGVEDLFRGVFLRGSSFGNVFFTISIFFSCFVCSISCF